MVGDVNEIEYVSYSRSLMGICNLNMVELERTSDMEIDENRG